MVSNLDLEKKQVIESKGGMKSRKQVKVLGIGECNVCCGKWKEHLQAEPRGRGGVETKTGKAGSGID